MSATVAPQTPGRPTGWYGLALCVRVAREHPDWTIEQVERRAATLQVMRVATDDDLYRKLRRSA